MSKKVFHELSIEDLLFETSLYKKIELDLVSVVVDEFTDFVGDESDPQFFNEFTVNPSLDFRHLIDVFFHGKPSLKRKVLHFCPGCDSTLSLELKSVTGVDLSLSPRPLVHLENRQEWGQPDREYTRALESFKREGEKELLEKVNKLFGKNKFVYKTLTMICSHDNSHTYDCNFVLVRESNDDQEVFYLMKTGQYPSYADYKIVDKKKYQKILASLNFDKEYMTAVGLFAHGVGIGSFVYLRRILEALITKAFKEAESLGSLTEEDYEWEIISPASEDEEPRKKRRGVVSKIGLLSDYLPEELVANSQMYGIASKALHELSEPECIEYFPVILKGIELILEQQYALKEKEKKTQELRSEVQKIQEKISMK